jgi:hypothetical protein
MIDWLTNRILNPSSCKHVWYMYGKGPTFCGKCGIGRWRPVA